MTRSGSPGPIKSNPPRIAAAIDAYRERRRADMIAARELRSWRLMLRVNRAYTLLLRRGWSGRWRWFKELFGARGGSLVQYEPPFADILDYLPLDWRDAGPGVAPASRAQRPATPGCYDVIVLPVFEYDFRFQRPQQLARQFAAEGHRVFWVSPGRRAPDAAYALLPLAERIFEVRLHTPIPNIYMGSLGEQTVVDAGAALRSLMEDKAIASACILAQLPFWRRIANLLRKSCESVVVYDCMDDWQNFPDVGAFLRAEEAPFSQEADVLLVSGQRLFDTKIKQGTHPMLVRNGVDYRFFSRPAEVEALSGVGRPVIGYYGAIAEWFDFDLMRELARKRPDWSFVLIGGLGLEAEVQGPEIGKLRNLPNVHLLGHKPYASLPAYLAAFDVCILPFRKNEITDATDPVKLYEYLSQGKAVIATDLEELRRHLPHVSLCSGVEAFHDAILHALEHPEKGREERARYSRENDWKSRLQQVQSAVVDAFPAISVIVVTHQSASFVDACLSSLRRHATAPGMEIVCVDNASNDGTAEILRRHAMEDERVKVIAESTNHGFSGANNIGVRCSKGEWLVLLNADTIVTAGWIERLLAHFRADPTLGLLNPVTNCAGNEVMIPCDYTDLAEMDRFAAALARDQRGKNMDIAVCPLFCTVIPRAVWNKIGDLDERFNVGMFEDDDYSWRVLQAGLRCAVAEDAFVHHFGGASFRKLDNTRREAIFLENREKFEKKWNRSWTPHKYRPGVEPNRHYFPEEFVSDEMAGSDG